MRRGFSLLEILIATAILAIVFAYVSGAVIQSGFFHTKAPLYSQASLLLRGAVLDIEAEYREDGFPENDVTNERCELPDEGAEDFECEYDVEKLDLEADELGEMAGQLIENLTAGAGEGGSILQAFQVLSFFFLQGEQPISPLCPATAPQFLDMCSVRLEVLEQNIMGMVTFFPTIIQQAAEKTRKLKVRIRNKALGDEPVLAIETFIVAVPEEQKLMAEEGAVEDPTADGTTPPPNNKIPPPPEPPP